MVCFRKIPVAKKNMDKGEGEVSRLSFDFFCLTVSKNAVGRLFRESLIAGIEKSYASEGYVTIFLRKFFVSQCQKFS